MLKLNNYFLFLLITSLLSFSLTASGQEEAKKDGFKFNGALRYNIKTNHFENCSDKSDPEFSWDTWFLGVNGSMGGIDLSFQYRFYPSSKVHMIHHGWFGYKFSDMVYGKLGVSQVPFGILSIASNSFFFQLPYYLGLEDDYDMGLKFDITPTDNLDIALAYYRQSEPQGDSDGLAGTATYSYNIVPGKGAIINNDGSFTETNATLTELNQFNARVAWRFVPNWEVGLSGQIGGIFNKVLNETTVSGALAAHLTGNFGNFNLKTEFIHYNYNAKDDKGNKLDVIQMGAFGTNYPGSKDHSYTGGVAAKANIYLAGLAYNIPVNWGPINNISPHIDYAYMDKANKNFYATQQLVAGFTVTAGPIYSYFDYGFGKNHPWLTSDFGKGLGSGIGDAKWNSSLTINLGYYF